ncbi:hypothetical protein [Runella rosea]|nr:hypothetical protein [Runella rosea]
MLTPRKSLNATGRTADAVKDLLPQVEAAFCYLEFDRGGGPH